MTLTTAATPITTDDLPPPRLASVPAATTAAAAGFTLDEEAGAGWSVWEESTMRHTVWDKNTEMKPVFYWSCADELSAQEIVDSWKKQGVVMWHTADPEGADAAKAGIIVQCSTDTLTARLAAADGEAARLRKMLERFVASPVAGFEQDLAWYECRWCKTYRTYQEPVHTYSHTSDCLIIQARAALADAITDKLAINRARTWDITAPGGHTKHSDGKTP